METKTTTRERHARSPISTNTEKTVDYTFTIGPESQPNSMLNSKRFVITSKKPLGKGCWGEVYEGRDTELGTNVAIKLFSPTEIAERQMTERGLDMHSAMKKEALEFSNHTHLVKRRYEVDEHGQPFLVMLNYKQGNLADRLSYFDRSMESKSERQKLAQSTAKGVMQYHQTGNVHGDLKPDNFMIADDGEVHLNDFGTSTVVSLQHSGKRDNMGCIYTRASECYVPDSRPTQRSDVFGESALIYRIFTGHYPLEDEINNSKDPQLLMRQLSENGLGDKILRSKIRKNIPLEIQKVLRKGLSFDPNKRYANGEEFQEALDNAFYVATLPGALKKHLTSTAKWLGAATAAGLLFYAAVSHEPTQLGMPDIVHKGETIVGNPIRDEQIKFEQEDAPYKKPVMNMVSNGEDYDMIRAVTNNKNVAFLASRYMRAALESRMLTPNDNQMAIFSTYHTATGGAGLPLDIHIYAPVKCIEYAMNLAKTPSGTIDLEDMCVIARLGTQTWNAARRASGSFDYKRYADAKDGSGKYIIPRDEKEFIDTWRGYLNSH